MVLKHREIFLSCCICCNIEPRTCGIILGEHWKKYFYLRGFFVKESLDHFIPKRDKHNEIFDFISLRYKDEEKYPIQLELIEYVHVLLRPVHISLVFGRHHYQWIAAKLTPMLGASSRGSSFMCPTCNNTGSWLTRSHLKNHSVYSHHKTSQCF